MKNEYLKLKISILSVASLAENIYRRYEDGRKIVNVMLHHDVCCFDISINITAIIKSVKIN